MSADDDEFALIRRFRAAFPRSDGQALLLGPGDDAALLRVPDGQALAVTTDTLVVDRHFPAAMPAELIGWRALAVNLSDLAAMGATPFAFQVAATLPDAHRDWIDGCARGMARLAMQSGAVLSGGNISRGELSLTITAMGLVSPTTALRRSGAGVGDGVYVSGTIGLASLGLAQARCLARSEWPDLEECLRGDTRLARYAVPIPRIALGRALIGVATAALDVSDGLIADLGHLCAASGVAARLHSAAIPVPSGMSVMAAAQAGDDYELCFTAPPSVAALINEVAAQVSVPLTYIGHIVDAIDGESGVTVDGVAVKRGGYLHF